MREAKVTWNFSNWLSNCLPFRPLDPQLMANRQKGSLRKILIAVKRNDGISACRRIDPSAMTSDSVTPDAAE